MKMIRLAWTVVAIFVIALAWPIMEADAQHRKGFRPGPPPAREEARKGQHANPMRNRGWLQMLKEKHPEEYERLQELRESDPEAFRDEIRKRFRQHVKRRMRKHVGPHNRECMELAKKYHDAENPEEKAALKQQLHDAVKKAFDARVEQQAAMIKRMEERLNKLRNHLATREANRDEICAERVEDLTRKPAMHW